MVGQGGSRSFQAKKMRVTKLKDISVTVGSALESISSTLSPTQGETRKSHVRASSRSIQRPEQRLQAAVINGRGIVKETWQAERGHRARVVAVGWGLGRLPGCRACAVTQGPALKSSHWV